MGGGGGTRTRYEASPEQREILGLGMPAVGQVARAITSGRPLFTVPGMPSVPDVSTVPEPVLPTQQYFQSFDPSFRQALMQPYQDIAMQGMEMLGSRGQLGSPRAGPSGAAGAYMGEFWSRAAPQITAQMWGMGAPEMQRYGQQQFQVGQMMPYERGLARQQQLTAAYQAPFQVLPAMMGGMAPTLPTGITTPTQALGGAGGLIGGLGGAGLGYGAASLAGATGTALLGPIGIGAMLGMAGLGGK